MPLYQQDDTDLLTVDFGDGSSLTLQLRSDGITVESSRAMNRKLRYADYVAEQVAKREEKLKTAGELPMDEFDKLTAEIEQWQNRPDNAEFMIDFVYQSASGWTDYFASRKAEQAGQLVEYTRENVAQIHITRLGKIVKAINEHYGWSEDEEKKAGNSLPLPLPSAAKESDTRTSMFKES